MTETATKSPRILLFEAAAIARFDHAKGWPGDFLPGQLAALMAGGWKDEYKNGYRLWGNIIAAAIKAGELETIEKSKTTEQAPRKIGFVKSWNHQHAGLDPDMYYQPDPVTTHWHEINRTACAAWLLAIGENPSEHVRAWLGPEWKEGPGASAGAESSPVIERRKRAALIRELRVRWLSIECDLRHSDENGLNAAAKLPEHGDWNKTAALRWAEENGKLVDGTSKPQGFAPPRKVKLM